MRPTQAVLDETAWVDDGYPLKTLHFNFNLNKLLLSISCQLVAPSARADQPLLHLAPNTPGIWA